MDTGHLWERDTVWSVEYGQVSAGVRRYNML